MLAPKVTMLLHQIVMVFFFHKWFSSLFISFFGIDTLFQVTIKQTIKIQTDIFHRDSVEIVMVFFYPDVVMVTLFLNRLLPLFIYIHDRLLRKWIVLYIYLHATTLCHLHPFGMFILIWLRLQSSFMMRRKYISVIHELQRKKQFFLSKVSPPNTFNLAAAT